MTRTLHLHEYGSPAPRTYRALLWMVSRALGHDWRTVTTITLEHDRAEVWTVGDSDG
jgi:hypothetical protein